MNNTAEDCPWTSYRYYIGEGAPTWLTTDFILGYFGKSVPNARKNYRQFVHDLIQREYVSPLLETVASTILGSPEFVCEIQEQHLGSKKADRDLPAMRELKVKPSLQEIMEAVKKAFTGNDRETTKAGIYLCHRYSGEKLKPIGELFHLTESGVTRASKRFEQKAESEERLKALLLEIKKRLKLSIA